MTKMWIHETNLISYSVCLQRQLGKLIGFGNGMIVVPTFQKASIFREWCSRSLASLLVFVQDPEKLLTHKRELRCCDGVKGQSHVGSTSFFWTHSEGQRRHLKWKISPGQCGSVVKCRPAE